MADSGAAGNLDAAAVIAKHLACGRYDDLPADAVEATKKSILDALAVISGASGTVPGCRELAELVLDAGGKPESTIIGFGGRVPAWMAAFATRYDAERIGNGDKWTVPVKGGAAPGFGPAPPLRIVVSPRVSAFQMRNLSDRRPGRFALRQYGRDG